MINLTDEMVSRLDSALADGYSCLVGTASKDGEPQISPKGSVMAFDRDTLAYWERGQAVGLGQRCRESTGRRLLRPRRRPGEVAVPRQGNRPRGRSHSPRSHGPLRPSRTGPGPRTPGCRRPH